MSLSNVLTSESASTSLDKSPHWAMGWKIKLLDTSASLCLRFTPKMRWPVEVYLHGEVALQRARKDLIRKDLYHKGVLKAL